ncbi:MAG: SOS response-associated peptidase [Flavobacteriales bacterium]|nr:SOS response-associated peptidase [Flavobacteriales bacterium]
MCYSSQLVIQVDHDFRKQNERMARRLKKRWAEEAMNKWHYANAFARPLWPVLTAEDPETFHDLQWGLVPTWAKDPDAFLKKAPTYNAVSGTAYDKPSFRGAMKHGHRCLIPVTGFYEWMHVGKVKYPHFIHLKSRELFFLAGIYENGTFSILTCPANPLMAHIHNSKKRMPVILPQAEEETWLKAGLTQEEVLALCRPYPDDDMEAWTVGRGITSRSADPNTPQAAVPVDYPELREAPRLP